MYVPVGDLCPDPPERGNRFRLSVLFMSVGVLCGQIKALLCLCGGLCDCAYFMCISLLGTHAQPHYRLDP